MSILQNLRVRIHKALLGKGKKKRFVNPYMTQPKVEYKNGMEIRKNIQEQKQPKATKTTGIIQHIKSVFRDDLYSLYKRTNDYRREQQKKIVDKEKYEQFEELARK